MKSNISQRFKNILDKNYLYRSYFYLLSSLVILAIITTGITTIFTNQGQVASAAWYNSNWEFRKKITIDHSKVDADLTDFPVLINYDQEGDLKEYAQSNGGDILFTSDDGLTKLSHQIENYDNTDGSIRAWVKLPTLSSTTNTELYIYYGNQQTSDQQNITDVWSNNYAGVWLMNEGEGITINDYSGNGNHGTMVNMDPATDWVEHDNGYALDFDGVDDYVSLSNVPVVEYPFTIIDWYETPATGSSLGFYMGDSSSNDTLKALQSNVGSYHVYYFRESGNQWITWGSPSASTEYMVAGVSQASNDHELFVDGTSRGTSTVSSSLDNYDVASIGSLQRLTPEYSEGRHMYTMVLSDQVSSEWISTSYNNQDSPSTFSTTSGAEVESVGWYNQDWPYRKKLTIDHTKVDDDLVDFPVSIALTDGNIVNKAQSNGDDLVITNTDGTSQLSHEIEEFDENTGEVIVHVKVPQLSQNTDTDIYLYYGNPNANNQENVHDVWSNGYNGIWHLSEEYWDSSGDNQAYNSLTTRHGTPRGDAFTYYDSDIQRRAGNFTATLDNSPSNPAAIRFGNNQGELRFNSQTEEYTIQGWFRGTESTDGYILSYGTGESGSMDYFIRSLSDSGGVRASAGGTFADIEHNFQDDQWHQVALINQNNQNNFQFKMLVNGDNHSTDWTDSGDLRESNDGFKIGCRCWTWGGNARGGYPGYINEVRVSSVARSPEWISTEYNNQSDPETFHSLSSWESWDTTAPNNPTSFSAWKTSSKNNELTSGNWSNAGSPHFEWSGASDPDGSGVDGYYLYYGTDETADPETTSGLIEDDASPHLTNSSTTSYTLGKEMTTDQTYYLRIKTIDAANNTASPETYFTYKYDNQPPNPVEYVSSDPAGCVTTHNFTLSWPEATDVGSSGIAHYEYKRSASGSIKTTSDLSVEIEPYQESDNVLYVRSVDRAGNKSNWRTGVYCVIGYISITDGPQVESKPASLIVNWKTDRKTSSYVRVYEGNNLITEQGQPEYIYNHQVEVFGLKPEADYRYQLAWADENGNHDNSGFYRASTATPPQVRDLTIQTLSPTSANISYQTTTPTTSQLLFGIENYQQTKQLNTTSATRYSHNLTNLEPDSTYYLTIKATTSDDFNFLYDKHIFTTPAYPQISNLRVQPIKDAPTSTIEVSWQTNVSTSSALTITPDKQEGGQSASRQTASSPKLTKEHSLTISDLADNTNYQLVVSGRDEFGNLASSDTQTITTAKDTRPPKISDVRLETSITGTGSNTKAQVIVNWQTDEPATAQVEYGIGSGGNNYQAKTARNEDYGLNHTIVISQLEPARTYQLRPISVDPSGNEGVGNDNIIITGKAQESVLDIIINKLKETFGFLTNIREVLGG